MPGGQPKIVSRHPTAPPHRKSEVGPFVLATPAHAVARLDVSKAEHWRCRLFRGSIGRRANPWPCLLLRLSESTH